MKLLSARRALLPLLLSAILSLAAAACSKEETAPAPVVRQPVRKEAAKAPEAAKATDNTAKGESDRQYDPAGKRDPFEPFLKAAPRTAARVDLSSLPPLQRYELGELKFVGVIWGPATARALIEDNEGKGYTVAVGSRIGRWGGVVTKISDGEIVVREESQDYGGTKVVRETSLKLRTSGGK